MGLHSFLNGPKHLATFHILYSASLDRYYLRHTTEAMEERLRKHLYNHGAWTSRAKDGEIIHHEAFTDKATAYRRELEVKSWKSRGRIEELIALAR